jgi:hypothetical protein
MISHGTSRFLKERLFDQSDPYQVIICEECGGFASSMTECKACKNDTMARVNLPYAAKIKHWQKKVALKELLPSNYNCIFFIIARYLIMTGNPLEP